MGRELRKVPHNWEHPKQFNGSYKPLLGYSYSKHLSDWEEEKIQWENGFKKSWDETNKWIPKSKSDEDYSYEEWAGEKPIKEDYMPEWVGEATHIQLYENTTEGTPISPVYALGEIDKLCQYASEKCTTFANFKATKEEWFEMLNGKSFIVTKEGLSFI